MNRNNYERGVEQICTNTENVYYPFRLRQIGYTRGFHVWQLNWPNHQRGTHAVIGVATKDAAPLHAPGYMSLIGINAEGFGWNIGILNGSRDHSVAYNRVTTFTVENKCYHNGNNTKGWPYPAEQPFEAPEKLFCILDMDEGQMAFATESKYLGVAFRGLKGKKLYPAVSVVWGHAEITLKYLGGLDRKLCGVLFFHVRNAFQPNPDS